MVISKKVSEKDVQKFIQKGGSVTKDEDKEEFFIMTLRMPTKMRKEIDALVKEYPGFSRTTWILQTIQKQLKVEELEFEKVD